VLPLSGVVAVAGSRHGSPWPAAPVVALVLASGGVVRVGDQRGVDAVVRLASPSAVVVEASSFPGPPKAKLAQRTRAVVLGGPGVGPRASCLLVFPPVGGAPALGPGSALALRLALEAALPVWVAGEPRPSGPGWVPLALAGVPGWALPPAQVSLL
jgi:hypothetical protein